MWAEVDVKQQDLIQPKEIPDGGVMWHDEWTPRVENVGDTTVHAITAEDKRGDIHGTP